MLKHPRCGVTKNKIHPIQPSCLPGKNIASNNVSFVNQQCFVFSNCKWIYSFTPYIHRIIYKEFLQTTTALFSTSRKIRIVSNKHIKFSTYARVYHTEHKHDASLHLLADSQSAGARKVQLLGHASFIYQHNKWQRHINLCQTTQNEYTTCYAFSLCRFKPHCPSRKNCGLPNSSDSSRLETGMAFTVMQIVRI